MSRSPENREWKKGSAELLILSIVEGRPRHGYDLARLIEERSEGALRFNAASLYPLLYKLERLGCIEGRWIEKPNARRRRLYRITPAGRRRLAEQKNGWEAFVSAIARVIGATHA
jgi:transcriptional regulator